MNLSLHPFRPRLLDALKGYNRQKFAADLGAGLTVGIVALPLAMAFGIASGVTPEQGLITAIVAGLIISAMGGSQVQIGGPAGAFIVIVYGIIERYGFTNLLLSTAMAGALLFVLGLFRLGAPIRYLPVSIVIGFTNGIAVLIALSQVRDLFGLKIEKMPGDFVAQLSTLAKHMDSFNLNAFLLGLACVGGLALWAWLFAPGKGAGRAEQTHAVMRQAQRLPGPIVALLSLSLLAWWFKLPVETIGSRFGELKLGLPALQLPPFSWETAQHLTIPTVTIALLGAIESLLCARVADNISGHPRHDPNQELMAQGLANMAVPLFGGIPATGTIARTVTNVRAGAATPMAGLVHAAALLLILLAAGPLAAHVPLAVLAGILMFVAWNMFEGHHFKRLGHATVPTRILMLGTFFLTIVFDLTVAVEVGVVMACAFFIWRMGTQFSITSVAATARSPWPADTQVFELYGALFFGAVGKVDELPRQIKAQTHTVVLDLHRLIQLDTSGVDAMVQLHNALQREAKKLVLVQVNDQPLRMIRSAGLDVALGSGGLQPDLATALQSL